MTMPPTKNERLRAVISQAIEDLTDEHYPQWATDTAKAKGKDPIGCILCWPQDSGWPCVSRMVADDLRQALGGDE